MTEHPIFGIIDYALDAIQEESNKEQTRVAAAATEAKRVSSIKKIIPSKPRIIPPNNINRETFPDEMQIENAVYVPEHLLQYLNRKVERNTRAFSNAMLKGIVPTLLSYTSGMNYVQAALRDGLGIEIQPEKGVEDAVKYITYLSVMMHFVKTSPWPIAVKKRFIAHISDQLAEKSIAALLDGNKNQKHSDYMSSQVHAIVSRNKAKSSDDGEESTVPIASRKRSLKSKV